MGCCCCGARFATAAARRSQRPLQPHTLQAGERAVHWGVSEGRELGDEFGSCTQQGGGTWPRML